MTKREKNRGKFLDDVEFLFTCFLGAIVSGSYLYYGSYDNSGHFWGLASYAVCLFCAGFLVGNLSNSTEKD